MLVKPLGATNFLLIRASQKYSFVKYIEVCYYTHHHTSLWVPSTQRLFHCGTYQPVF